MLTVPEAARRARRNPETIRRWIREGKLHATKVGTQHVLDERDLAEFLGEPVDADLLPLDWQRTFWGGPMPDFVGGMDKTTVYLTPRQKRALTRAASAAGQSEAELIREGIDTVTARYRTAEPTLPLIESGLPDLAQHIDEHLAGFGDS